MKTRGENPARARPKIIDPLAQKKMFEAYLRLETTLPSFFIPSHFCLTSFQNRFLPEESS